MPKYYEEGKPFKFILEDDPEVIPVEDGSSRVKINSVSNVIPLRITCEIDGEPHEISGYVDYETQRVIISEGSSMIPDEDEFKEQVMLFLRRRAMRYAPLNKDIPSEVYDQLKKGQSYGNPKNMKPEDFRRQQ